jgi:hypothetical protein
MRYLALFLFWMPAASIAGDIDARRLHVAEAALTVGDYALAERELNTLVTGKNPDTLAVKLLAEAYWRQGKDKDLLDHADRHLKGRPRDIWWCRVLERRGHGAKAADCWTGLGETERARRAMRAEIFTQELAPGMALGVRRGGGSDQGF